MEEIQYKLVRSRRRTVSVSVSREGEVVVRAPLIMPQEAVDAFVAKHAEWIRKNRSRASEAAQKRPKLTEEEIALMRASAHEYMSERTRYFAELMGVRPREVRITLARARWGSCSARNTICYSYKIMLLPPELIDYIVVHELAHIAEKNHGKSFYAIIGCFMPDFREREKRIRELSPELP